MLCPRCQSQLDERAGKFCPFCGASLPREPVASAPVEAIALDAPCPRHPAEKATELCDRCGAFACRLCSTRTPSGRVLCNDCLAREEPARWSVPWERRSELGFFRAYWETVKEVLLKPSESLGRLDPAAGRWSDPLSFAMLSSLVGCSGIALLAWLGFLAALVGGGGKSVLGGGLAAAGFVLLAALAGAVIGAFVIGGIEHLALTILGAKTRGFEATLRVCCYSYAPMILGLVPVCGAYAYPVWQVVCRILGYRGVHRTSGGIASAAVLLPTCFCCVGGIALYAAALAASFWR
jgi:hypothetical protein